MPAYQRLLALGLFAVAFLGLLRLPVVELPVADGQPVDDEGRPRLVVLLVFDQLRGDYLEKWRPLFVEGGFKRLQTEGAWFTNCHYPYAYTLTAPGHASLSTGTVPAKHGIIANDWYDRANGETVSSVTPPPEKKRSGSGPYRRQVRTVGDVLLDVLGGRSRVVSVSIKDRAAILLAAIRAQAVYWFSGTTGNFVTSPFYRDEPHSWVKAFNKTRKSDRWIGKSWNRLRPDLDYVAHSGPDDFFAEGIGHGQGQTFPHPTPLGTGAKAKEDYYSAMQNSPFGNDLLMSFAKTAIQAERLGQSSTTDLLCVSFSSNDLVGHCWGPDSQEVLDMTLRSDVMVAELLQYLDAKVGKGRYTVAVSADHGVCPLPEFAARQGTKAGRVAPEILTSRAEAHLNRTFLPKGESVSWFEVPNKYNPWAYLNPKVLKSLKLESATVERSLADWMTEQPGVLKAFTRTELVAAPSPSDTELLTQVRRSYRPEASGDVMVIVEPYHMFFAPLLSKNPEKNAAYRTTHGTPHHYDTHVPLLIMGPRIVPGTRTERVVPQHMATILAESLRIPPPSEDYSLPDGLFAD